MKAFLAYRGLSSYYILTWQRLKSSGLFPWRVLVALMRAPPSESNYLPKTSLPNTLEIKVSTCEFGGDTFTSYQRAKTRTFACVVCLSCLKELDLSHLTRHVPADPASSQMNNVNQGITLHSHQSVQLTRLGKLTPVAFMSWCQCLSLRAGLCSSATALSTVVMSFTVPSRPAYASHTRTSLSRDQIS